MSEDGIGQPRMKGVEFVKFCGSGAKMTNAGCSVHAAFLLCEAQSWLGRRCFPVGLDQASLGFTFEVS